MTRYSPARSLLAVLVAAGLAACGGGDAGVDESAAQAGISSSQDTGEDQSSGTAGEDAGDSDDDGEPQDDGGSPGGPGGDPEGNGGGEGEGGGEAEGNPGAPGDVAVFEEAGVTFGDLRNGSAQEFCVERGLCTLAEPEVIAGDPDDLGGVDECLIREKTDIVYDPPARDGRFPEGATVTARVDCSTGEDEGTPEEGTPDEGTPDEGTPEEGTPDEGTPDEGTPDEQSPDEGTPDDAPDESGTDPGTEDQPQE